MEKNKLQLWAMRILLLCAIVLCLYLWLRKPQQELDKVRTEKKAVETKLDTNTVAAKQVHMKAKKTSKKYVKRADSVIQVSNNYVPVKDEVEAAEYLSNYPN